MNSLSVTIQMKATLWVILFYGTGYYTAQGCWTFASVDEILKCDHSNESYWAVLSCGAVYYAVQGGSNFWVCWWNPKVWPFKWKLLSILSCCTVYYAVQGGSYAWICGWNAIMWVYSNESYWTGLLCGTFVILSKPEKLLNFESAD